MMILVILHLLHSMQRSAVAIRRECKPHSKGAVELLGVAVLLRCVGSDGSEANAQKGCSLSELFACILGAVGA